MNPRDRLHGLAHALAQHVALKIETIETLDRLVDQVPPGLQSEVKGIAGDLRQATPEIQIIERLRALL